MNQYVTLSGSTLTGSLEYDNVGNLVNDGKQSYAYDYKNRLVQVTKNNIILAELAYDMLGRRYQKTTETAVVSYTYAGENVLGEEKTTGSRTFKKEYINGLGVDDVIAYDVEEPNLSIAERGELNFCEQRVLPYATDFTKYNWTSIVGRCNALSSSGSEVVTNRYYFHKDNLGSVTAI